MTAETEQRGREHCPPFSHVPPLVGLIDAGLVGSISGRGAARAKDAEGTPTQSHISPSILVYEEKNTAKPLGIRSTSSLSLLLSSLELSDTKVYEP